MKLTVFVFGNPDLLTDSLPLRILPKLKKLLPDVEFKVQDPNEEWEVSEEMILIDTVFGIDKVKVFNDLKQFVLSPRFSLHDFDVAANLWYLQKLGKFKKTCPASSRDASGSDKQTRHSSKKSTQRSRKDARRCGIKIIGLPPTISEDEAIRFIAPLIVDLQKKTIMRELN
jgi:hypothetical protein